MRKIEEMLERARRSELSHIDQADFIAAAKDNIRSITELVEVMLDSDLEGGVNESVLWSMVTLINRELEIISAALNGGKRCST